MAAAAGELQHVQCIVRAGLHILVTVISNILKGKSGTSNSLYIGTKYNMFVRWVNNWEPYMFASECTTHLPGLHIVRYKEQSIIVSTKIMGRLFT